MAYYNHQIKLEHLFLIHKNYSEEECFIMLFELRKEASAIEQIDNELNIRKYKRLIKQASDCVKNYVINNYG